MNIKEEIPVNGLQVTSQMKSLCPDIHKSCCTHKEMIKMKDNIMETVKIREEVEKMGNLVDVIRGIPIDDF